MRLLHQVAYPVFHLRQAINDLGTHKLLTIRLKVFNFVIVVLLKLIASGVIGRVGRVKPRLKIIAESHGSTDFSMAAKQ